MYPIIIHGSENSLDKDAYIVIPNPLNNKDSKSLCSEYRELNANLIVVKDGVVDWSYKGTKDECNNSILETYSLHVQEFENPIIKKTNRLYGLKMIRTIRGLLSYISRTEHRENVKKALSSGDLDYKLNVLSSIDLNTIIDFNKSSIIETYKFFAFQMGQTKALLNDNVELFTKNSVALYYPKLTKYLNREESNPNNLQDFFKEFIEDLKTTYKKINKHELYVTNFHSFKEVLDVKNELVKPPVVVFDMDGTLFDESHRRHLLESGNHAEYFDLCHLDKPIENIIELTREYKKNGYEIWIMTGRSISCEEKTIKSLIDNNVPYDFIKMRAADNRLPDFVLKPAWIGKYIGTERVEIIYDDMDKVIKGFQDKGLNVVDVKKINSNVKYKGKL